MELEILGGVIGGTFSIAVAWKVLDFLFSTYKENQRANRATINNHMQHNTEVLTQIVETNRNLQESHARIEDCILKNSEVGIRQSITNEAVEKAIDRLNVTIDKGK